ncbi:MAG: hypothetical protein P1P83_08320 [Bacteroidales bacterium]|nr:hypothetical protein [Bacteroidales bacterium]
MRRLHGERNEHKTHILGRRSKLRDVKQPTIPYIRHLLLVVICLLVLPLEGRGESGMPPFNEGNVPSGIEWTATCCGEGREIPGVLSPSGEKIFVHTDREVYIAGENIWFKVYLLDAQSGRLISTSNLAYVEILNSENRPVMQKRIILEEGCGPGEALLPDTLSSGSYLLRAYTGAMKNFMPDGCFMKRINIYNALRTEAYPGPTGTGEQTAGERTANSGTATRQEIGKPASGNVQVEMESPDSCGTREKVILEFDVTDNGPVSAGAARLSIAVAPSTGSHGPDIADVVTQVLPKESMPAETPDYYFEKEYHFIQGRLFNRNTQMPDSGRYLFLSIPGKNAVFFYSRTDADGRFHFSVPADRVTRELIIQPEVVNPDNTIRIESSFSEEYFLFRPAGGTLPDGALKQVSLMKVNYQVNRIYETENYAPSPEPQSAAKPVKSFYGIPDISLNLNDFIRLPVMTEVFYELVPGVTLRERRAGYEITVADPYYDVVYEQPPITFIDGVVVSDPAVIAGLDPDHVERIDVIRDRYVVGDYLFFGLVNVITYDGDYSRVSLPDHAVRLPYRVADPVRRFFSPGYSTEERKRDRTPDFRNTLFWEPSVTNSVDGKYRVEFWSSDVPGDYEINLQGITGDGHPVSFRKVISIK